MRIVIAPDSFKGTADAASVARAIGEGWASRRPDDEVVLAPMADGGEGTLDAFAAAIPGAQRVPVRVTGPDGREVASAWLRLPDGRGVVELASTSGITLLDAAQAGGGLRGLDADTRGFGEAIRAALAAGVEALVLGIGGSASTDGGAGMLAALGAGLRRSDGTSIAPSARGLAELAAADLSGMLPLPPGGASVITDVTNPLLGPSGAAAVFGPQKGLDPEGIAVAEAGLARLAGLVARVDPATPGAGAAGGTGFGLLAWGARLEPGAAAVAEVIGLPARVATADLVIAGEGRYDAQSAGGKAPGHVLGLARDAGIPACLVAGRIDAGVEDWRQSFALDALAGSAAAAMAEPLRWLREAGARLAAARPA